MRTTITDDWVKHTWAIKTRDGAEYTVTVHVYLRLKHGYDPHHWPPRDQAVCDWTLEGWETLPPYPLRHEKEIENQLLQRLDDEYERR